MTLKELYQNIGGDYEQAMRVLRIEKLVDKHIRKFTRNGVVEKLLEAGKTKDAALMFETSHAAKGICGNLGLTQIADLSSEISEEFREGNPRRMSDAEVDEKLAHIRELYGRTAAGIGMYEGNC